MVPMTPHEEKPTEQWPIVEKIDLDDDDTGNAYLEAFADQMSKLVALCADTNASVKRTEATVAGLADVLKTFAEVNPQELMGLLGGIIGK